MQVRQIMQKEVVTALPSVFVQEIARKMKEQNIGSVPICDDSGRLKGILTDRDICLAVAVDGKDPAKTLASDIMTEAPLTTELDTDLEAALRLMNRAHARRLPVVENGKLVGVLSMADVAGELRKQFDQFFTIEETYVKH